MLRHHCAWKAYEQQPLFINSLFILSRQRPPCPQGTSCQGGYAPPSLGVRVAFWIKNRRWTSGPEALWCWSCIARIMHLHDRGS